MRLVNPTTSEPALAYEPGVGWSTLTVEVPVSSSTVSDQIQGFEISGKLWFVYSGRAFVFDPVALTVTAKAVLAGISQDRSWLVDGKIHIAAQNQASPYDSFGAIYDPVEDLWVVRTDLANELRPRSGSEAVAVTRDGVIYSLSANTLLDSVSGPALLGVYGLTGVALDKPRAARLEDVKDDAVAAATRTATMRSNLAWNPRSFLIRANFVNVEMVFLTASGDPALPLPTGLSPTWVNFRSPPGSLDVIVYPSFAFTGNVVIIFTDADTGAALGSYTLTGGVGGASGSGSVSLASATNVIALFDFGSAALTF